MEECPELISPRISFSHDFATVATPTPAATQPSRPDRSLMSRRRRRRAPEPEFDFANAAAADVAPADRLFAGGKLLPVPPLPPTTPSHDRARPSTCGHHRPATASGCAKQQPQVASACRQQKSRPPRSWTSPFSRSSSVNSAATRTAPAGRFTCPFMRSRSAGSSAREGSVSASVFVTAAGHRPPSKKDGGGGARPVYYYGLGGGRDGTSSSHGGVRVSPVLNVTSIGTSLVNLLSFLLCDCSEKTTKSRAFVANC